MAWLIKWVSILIIVGIVTGVIRREHIAPIVDAYTPVIRQALRDADQARRIQAAKDCAQMTPGHRYVGVMDIDSRCPAGFLYENDRDGCRANPIGDREKRCSKT